MSIETIEIQQTESNFAARLKSFRVPWMFDRLSSEHLVISVPSNAVADVVPKVSGMIAQILALYPPGMVRLLLIDPVGLGQNFASFHALKDYDEKLITNRVWSNRGDIREKLEEIIAHIENVVQTYLRADFESIEQYNEQAGVIAEPYRFIFIYDFPENFDNESCLALERIIANGARCGVHVVMVWDESKELPHSVKPEQIIQRAKHYKMNGNELELVGLEPKQGVSVRFTLDTPPEESIVSQIVKNHGESAEEGAVVEVPYENLMRRVMEAKDGEFEDVRGYWSLDSSQQLIAPLGPSGVQKIRQLIFARGTTVHHALIVGRIGSGKSNLLHVLVISLAELYSPEELEIFLVDFKKGVEFKSYAVHKLPHARVVAIESELEFGLSVLRGMDAEMTRRGNAFRAAQDEYRIPISEIDDYREKTGDKMPRILLIVDEFHELFVEEERGSQEARNIVERIARQGRSFGMHMILTSQSISRLRIPRAILDQVGARIAMQCSEADSRTILADDNDAARFLERSGEAIYNDRNGLKEGNTQFQVAYLPPEEREDRLIAIRNRAEEAYANTPNLAERFSGPFVFEGSEPSDFKACKPFDNALREWPKTSNATLNLWVGEPIAMLPAHAVNLKRQSGANLLVIDRNEELAFGVVFSSVLSIAAQENPKKVVFHFIDMSSADAYWVDHSKTFAVNFPHQVNVCGRREIDTVISELAEEEIGGRDMGDPKQMSKIILVLFGIQRARNLRRQSGISYHSPSSEDNVHDNLSKILQEGPEFGIHTIIWCDTVQSFSRIFDNSDLNEIGHRVSGVLSTNDSVTLFDEQVASNLDRENRMICYDDEKIGYTSIRPYRPCDLSYVKELGKILNDK